MIACLEINSMSDKTSELQWLAIPPFWLLFIEGERVESYTLIDSSYKTGKKNVPSNSEFSSRGGKNPLFCLLASLW